MFKDSLFNVNENKPLIKHLESLLEQAKKSHPKKSFNTFYKYYTGRVEKNSSNTNYNIIKPIVETKVALTLDNMMDATVKVSDLVALNDNQELEMYNLIADILSEISKRVDKINKFDTLKKEWVRNVMMYGVAVAKVSWDADMSNGLGDIKLESIDPNNFYPDPNAKEIDSCNYIFVRIQTDSYTLKRKYPQFIDEIDKLVKKSSDKEGTQSQTESSRVLTGKINNSDFTQVYSNGGSYEGLKNSSSKIELWECYLKDETVFYPSKDDSTEDTDMKRAQFQYPYGRCIVFSDKTIFEDKSIEYPFGFPFQKFNDIVLEDFWGQGEIEDQINLQDRVNKAYARVRFLIQNYLSTVVYEKREGLNEYNFINSFAVALPPGTLNSGGMPQVLTNNTISELKSLIEYIAHLKNASLEIAKLNPMMMTGERASGVNSGQMVQDLNESPMASIRSTQLNFKEFLIGIQEKKIALIQLFYKTPRIIRIADGKKIARITPPYQGDGEQYQGTSGKIEVYENDDLSTAVNQIDSDLSIGEYEVEVVAGTDMPRSKSAVAQLMMQLATQGFLGDVNDPFVKGKILEVMGVPNHRVFEKRMKEIYEEQKNTPPNPAMLVDKIGAKFQDLSPEHQNWLLVQMGFPESQIMQEPLNPIPNMN